MNKDYIPNDRCAHCGKFPCDYKEGGWHCSTDSMQRSRVYPGDYKCDNAVGVSSEVKE